MSQDDIKVTLSNQSKDTKKVHTERGRLTVTTSHTNVELASIVRKAVPGAKLTFRSSQSRDGKSTERYDIELTGRRNLTLGELARAIGNYLRGDGDALSKVNSQ